MICSECKKKISTNRYKIGSNVYCKECFDKHMAELEDMEGKKRELYDYIKKLFVVSDIPESVLNSIDRHIAGGKKVVGIQKTLHYYYEIEEHTATRIEQVPFIINDYYETARKYEKSIRELAERNNKVDLTPNYVTVRVRQSDLEKRKPSFKKPDYDISSL